MKSKLYIKSEPEPGAEFLGQNIIKIWTFYFIFSPKILVKKQQFLHFSFWDVLGKTKFFYILYSPRF